MFCMESYCMFFFQIMALLAPIIGAEKTREYFLDKFLELCTNENYDVRKMCAVFCPHLCKVMGIDVSEKHLVWHNKCPPSESPLLTQTFLFLIIDSSIFEAL